MERKTAHQYPSSTRSLAIQPKENIMTPLNGDIEHVIVTEDKRSMTLSLDPSMSHSAISNALSMVAGIKSIDLRVVVELEDGVTIDDVEDEVVAMLGINEGRKVDAHGPIAY